MHHDPYHNIFVQLHSTKKVLVFPPEARDGLSLHTDPLMKNSSRIRDVFDPLEFAKLAPRVRSMAYEAELSSGDGLYIPEGWFHSFRGSPGISASVNWWFR